MTDQEDPEERRTEGVRIIGAQEAAEAAGRPDVVRRRRGGEKRYGDRPDRPAPASDLPKITISTTEGEMVDQPDRFGSVPVVRPGADAPDAGSLQWADDAPDEADERVYGHARLIENEPEVEPAPEPVETPEPEAVAEPDPEPFAEPAFDPEPAPSPEMDRWASSAAFEPIDPDEVSGPLYFDEPVVHDDPEVTQRARPSDDETAGPDQEALVGTPSDAEPSGDLAGAFGAADDDDSFVLPHWTEPPTGQVPKVVIGDDAPDPEPLATYGSQPRWRDEGERTGAHDFDDLIDDGPSLGVLGRDDSVEDDFFSEEAYPVERFTDDVDVDYYDDDELSDDFDDDDAAARTPRRSSSEPRDGGGGGGDRNLVTAVAVGVGLVAVGLLCFFLGALTTMILAAVVVTVAALEYFTAVRTAGHNPATLLGIVGVAGIMVAAYTSGLAAYPVVLGLTVLSGLLWFLWVAPGEGAMPNLGLTLLGVLWIGVLGSFATLFLGLGRALEDSSSDITSNPGIGVLIAAVIASVSHDVGAYFIGRYFGRTPLSAASPNKTQEGLAGGVLVSLVVTFVVVGLIGIDPIGAELSQAFIFALLCALVAPLGDLAESFIKRDLRIKDMGAVLPGHGGVLDRFDALLFVLPVAYFVTVLFDIWSSVS